MSPKIQKIRFSVCYIKYFSDKNNLTNTDFSIRCLQKSFHPPSKIHFVNQSLKTKRLIWFRIYTATRCCIQIFILSFNTCVILQKTKMKEILDRKSNSTWKYLLIERFHSSRVSIVKPVRSAFEWYQTCHTNKRNIVLNG